MAKAERTVPWAWLFAKALALFVGFTVVQGFCFAAVTDASQEISVSVDIEGDVVRIKALALMPANVREVWEVLTDFEHLPGFVSNIASSRIIARDGNVVRVAQTGKAGIGPFMLEFQSTREFALTPYEKFESRMVAGNMKHFLGKTRLEAAAAGTWVHYQAEAVPDTILPLGPARSTIEAETREHYLEIRKEVLRRKGSK